MWQQTIWRLVTLKLNKKEFEDDDEYNNVDYNIGDILSGICSNEEILCVPKMISTKR